MAAVERFRVDALVRVLARADDRLRALALLRRLAVLRDELLAVLRPRLAETDRVDAFALLLLRQLLRRARAEAREPDFRASARPRLTPQPTER